MSKFRFLPIALFLVLGTCEPKAAYKGVPPPGETPPTIPDQGTEPDEIDGTTP